MSKRQVGLLCLRIGIAVVLLAVAWGMFFGSVTVDLGRLFPFAPGNELLKVAAIVEAVTGIMLLIGLFTRVFAWVAAVIFLMFVVGGSFLGLFISASLIKDVGLIGGAVALALNGSHLYSLDARLKIV